MKLLLLGNQSTNTCDFYKVQRTDVVTLALMQRLQQSHTYVCNTEAKLQPLDVSINKALKELSNFGLIMSCCLK